MWLATGKGKAVFFLPANTIKIQSYERVSLTNSKLVAMKFGKRHSDVIRAIEDVFPKLSENEQKRNFATC